MNTLSSALFFILKKICQKSYYFPYNVLQRFSQSYSQTFWVTNLYFQVFFIMDPNFMSHQFSAQPTRKDKTNPKINKQNPLKNKCL